MLKVVGSEAAKTVLRDLKRRGMPPPVVAVGDGALGFWAAVRDVWPKTRAQRDWFHYADQGIMPSATRRALWDMDVVLMRSA